MRKQALFFSALLLSLLTINACNEGNGVKETNGKGQGKAEGGEKLAQTYCQSCHLFPDPKMAGKKQWLEQILPEMGPRLGIFSHRGKQYPSAKSDPRLPENFYPDQPVMSPNDWQQILDYFASEAPDKLPPQNRRQKPRTLAGGFDIIPPAPGLGMPATSCILIDTISSKRRIFRGDALRRLIFEYDHQLRLIDSLEIPVAVTDLKFIDANHLAACFVGVLQPNNGQTGFIRIVNLDPNTGKMKLDGDTIIRDLARPVQMEVLDIDQDGMLDYLVCEFGNLTGSLTLFRGRKNGGYEKQILKNTPGSIAVKIDDYNHDSKPDIWVLFTQGDENISLFTNKGGGSFDQQTILRFPSINGSSFFDLTDVDQDGQKDIVYTCGDNGDYSQVLKPYHGIYIFLNNGNNQFKEQFFYPINGCFKARAADYDQDGDIDIASIAYFADYARQPEEGFIFLQNTGGLSFQPYSLPATISGRWLCMESGDLDADGRLDLILGNMSVGPTVVSSQTDWRNGPALMMLKNKFSGDRTGKK